MAVLVIVVTHRSGRFWDRAIVRHCACVLMRESVSALFVWGVSVGQRQETPLSRWTHDVIWGNGCALCLSPLWTWLFKDRLDRSLTHEIISTHSLIHSHFNVRRSYRHWHRDQSHSLLSLRSNLVSQGTACLASLWHTNTFLQRLYFKKEAGSLA